MKAERNKTIDFLPEDAPEYLARCLRSLTEQTAWARMEIVLVDDGSSDRSGAICDAFAREHPNAKVIHQRNADTPALRW